MQGYAFKNCNSSKMKTSQHEPTSMYTIFILVAKNLRYVHSLRWLFDMIPFFTNVSNVCDGSMFRTSDGFTFQTADGFIYKRSTVLCLTVLCLWWFYATNTKCSSSLVLDNKVHEFKSLRTFFWNATDLSRAVSGHVFPPTWPAHFNGNTTR